MKLVLLLTADICQNQNSNPKIPSKFPATFLSTSIYDLSLNYYRRYRSHLRCLANQIPLSSIRLLLYRSFCLGSKQVALFTYICWCLPMHAPTGPSATYCEEVLLKDIQKRDGILDQVWTYCTVQYTQFISTRPFKNIPNTKHSHIFSSN